MNLLNNAHEQITKDMLENSEGYVCPASKQGNQCKECRACWNDKVSEVSYIAHQI